MIIENFTPWTSLLGGLMIGSASALLMLTNGKIAGISGITKGILSPTCESDDRKWRMAFVFGLLLGGAGIVAFLPGMTALNLSFNLWQMVLAGLLVGVGTAMGNGCTSGHGVCGLGRRSSRSLASVLTFMGTGFVTVFIMFHVLKMGV